jgi:Zn-dependent peptidase ImmA (M78 family)
LTYEELQMQHGELLVIEADLSKVKGLKGLYVDGCIAVEKNITLIEKGCILAEEIGHHLTSFGDILNQDNINNRKQEHQARNVAYDLMVGLEGIIASYKAGCRNTFEIADYLDVTEDFLRSAIDCYRSKYGLMAKVKGYVVYFEPCLGVMEFI